ncbi:hypothetical protein ACPA9J_34990 [Pseudomonas aeruginosa]
MSNEPEESARGRGRQQPGQRAGPRTSPGGQPAGPGGGGRAGRLPGSGAPSPSIEGRPAPVAAGWSSGR